jgi:hypothetical protein
MVAMKVVAMKVFERNGHQHLEKVSQTGRESFELVGHTSEPYGGPYACDLTLGEFLQWATACPEQGRLIPADK